MAAADEAVRSWAARNREILELDSEIASAFEQEAQAQRLMLTDAAAAKLKAKVVAAVRRGELI